MSIFKKKGTVESLFRIGATDEETGHRGNVKDGGEGEGKHEVYYVRGRPFIAPTKADKPAAAAPAKSKKTLLGGPSAASTPRSAGPSSVKKKEKTALAASAPKMAEEEWAALFRNNLLRSCWKPGLNSEEVEVMHRWMHPDLWLAARKWKRRTWRLDLITIMIKNMRQRQIMWGFRQWWKWRLSRANPILKTRGRRALRRWHRWALLSKSIISCQLKAPFAQLKNACMDGLIRRRRLRKAIYTFRFRGVVKAYNTWESRVRAIHDNRERMRQTLKGWKGNVRRALNTWKRQLELLVPVKLVAARWLNATMYAMFHYWAETYMGYLERLRSTFAHAGRHWIHASLSRAVNSWKAALEAYRTMLRAAVRLLSRRLLMVLNTWRGVCEAVASRRMRMTAAIETMRGSKVRKCMNTWRGKTVDARKALAPMARGLAHLMNRLLSRGWVGWTAYVAKRARLAGVASTLTPQGRAKRAALNTWLLFAEAAGTRRRRLTAALNEMRGAGTRKGWNTWEAWVEKRMAMLRAASGLLHRRLRLGWNAWVAAADERAAKRARMRGVVGSFKGTAKAFNAWLAFAEEKAKMRRALSGLANPGLRRGVNRWVQRAEEEASVKRRMHAALAELMGKGVRKGWNRWVEAVAQRERMAAAALHIFLREASRAFAAWADKAGGMAARAARARGALRSLSPEGRAMRMGLNSWMERAAQGARMRRAAASMLHKGLNLGMNSWVAYKEKRDAQLALLHRAARGMSSPLLKAFNAWAERLDQGDDLATRAIRHLMNRQLSAAWNSWAATVRLRMTALAAVARLRFRKLAQAINQWAGMGDGGADVRERMVVQARRMKAAQGTLKAWNTWAAQGRSFRLIRRAGMGFRHGSLKRATNGWVAYAEARAEMVRKLTKGLSGLRNKELRAAWGAWEERAFRPNPMDAALARWRNGALVGGLLRWKAATEELLLMARGLSGLRNGKLKLVWNTWGAWMEERLAAMAAIERTLRGMSSPLKRPFNTWRATLDKSGDPRERALRFLVHRKLPPALNTWLAEVERRRQLRRAMSGLVNAPLRRAYNRLLKRPPSWYNRWHATAAGQAAKAAKIGAVLASISPEGRAKRKALNSWAELVAQRALMRRAGGSFFYRKARLAFNGWAESVAAALDRRARAEAALKRLSPEGRAMTKALNSWIAKVEMQRLLLRAGASLFYRAARKAFTNWDFLVQQSYHIEASLFRVMNQKLLRAFNAWQANKGRASPMKQAAGRMRNRPLSMAFNQWYAIYEALNFARRSLAHLMYQGLSKGLRMWLEYLELLDVAARAMSGFRNGGLKKGFNTWVAWTEERFEALALMERGLGGLRGGPKKKAFNAWADKTFGAPDPMYRALAHFANKELSAAYLSWVEATALWLVMMNALAALKNRELRKGYNGWLEWAAACAERRERMRATLARMSSPAVKAFNKWAHVLALLGPIRQAAFRLRNRNLVKALGSWRVLMLERMRMKQALASMDPLKRAARNALRAWRRGGEAEDARLARLQAKGRALLRGPELKALNSWKLRYHEWREMRRALSGIFNGKLRRGMNAWLAQAAAARAKRDKIAATLRKASPEGRAMLKVLNSWAPHGRNFRKMKGVAFALKHRRARVGMSTWRARAEEAAAERDKLRAALVALSPDGRKKKAAMNKLKACLEMYRLLLRAGASLFHRKVKKALNNWHYVVEQTYRIADALAGLANAKLQKAFNSWLQAPPHPAKKALDRWKNKPLSMAFNSWVGIYLELMRVRRSLAHMMYQGLSKGLRMWLEYLELLDVAQRAMFGLRNGGLKKGFNGWVLYTEQRFEMLGLMEKGLGGLRQGPALKAFNKWAELIYGPPDPMYRALAHLVNRELSRALLSWGEATARWLTMRGALKRLFSRQLSKAFETWQEKMEAWAERRARMSAVLAGFQGGLRKAYNQWAHVLELLAPLRAGLHRLIHRQTSKAFESWQALYEEKLLMRRALASVLHAPLKRVWNAWRVLLQARAEQAALMKRSLLRATPQGKAFNSWAARMLALKPVKRAVRHWQSMQLVKALGSWEKLVLDAAAKRRALAGFFNAGAKKAVNKWKAMAAERAAARERARAALYKLSPEGRKKTKALNAWKYLMETLALMRRAGAAIFYRKVKRALNNWHFVVEQRYRIEAALFRVMNQKLLRAFNAWRKSPSKPSPMKKAASRMRNKPLAMAFDAWWARVEEYYLRRRSLSHLVNRGLSNAWRSWEAYLDMLELFARAGAKLTNSSLNRGFNGWCAWADERAATRAKMEAIAASLTSHKRKAFNSWADLLGNIGPRERALRHLMNRSLSKGWRAWEAVVLARERARRALAHFAGQGLVRALGSWEEFVEMRRNMRRAGAALFLTASRKALTTWGAYADARLERRERMRAVLAGFAGPLKKVWNTWLAMLEARAMMRQSMARLVRANEARALNTWHTYASERALQRNRMRAALSGLSKVLRTWQAYMEALRLKRKALSGLVNGALKRGFVQWGAWLDERYAAQEKARGAIMRSTPQGKAFNTWLAYLEAQAPMRRALLHLANSSASKAWFSWLSYLEMLEKKARVLAHLFHRGLSRGWRAWEARVAENELFFRAFAALRNREAKGALNRWRRSWAEREEKLRKMRGALYALGDGHKTKKCLNSWKGLVQMNAKVLGCLARVLHRAESRAWNRWYDRVVKAEGVRAKMRGALSIALRKGFNSWTEAHEHRKFVKKSLAHWRNAGVAKVWRKWSGGLVALYRLRRSMGHLFHRNLVKGLNSWLLFMERRALMRSALLSLVRSSSKRAVNTWRAMAAERAAARAKARAALFTLQNVPLKKAVNKMRAASDAMRPLKRAMAHWRNKPLSQGWNKLHAHAVKMREVKAKIYRWRNAKVGKALNAWVARTPKRGSAKRRAIAGIINRPQRQALNSWLAYAAGRRRLRGLLNTFANPAYKRAFNKLKLLVRRKSKPPKSPPRSPHQWRMIKAMTWRECCSWLTRVGIPVSRSPPTLIRTLKEGFVYQELVRKLSPAYYVRHKVAHCHESNGVFLMVQQFLDTELVISIVGCQKLDVIALEAGKAIDHLQLVMLFKTLLEGTKDPSGGHGMPEPYGHRYHH